MIHHSPFCECVNCHPVYMTPEPMLLGATLKRVDHTLHAVNLRMIRGMWYVSYIIETELMTDISHSNYMHVYEWNAEYMTRENTDEE